MMKGTIGLQPRLLTVVPAEQAYGVTDRRLEPILYLGADEFDCVCRDTLRRERQVVPAVVENEDNFDKHEERRNGKDLVCTD
jgi:hypothetical protein